MEKDTPKYLKPLQGLKDRLIKTLIASLIKLFTNPKSGNKKLLLSLFILAYSTFYAAYKHVYLLIKVLAPYRNWCFVIAFIAFWVYIAFRLITSHRKLKKELKEIQSEERELGI